MGFTAKVPVDGVSVSGDQGESQGEGGKQGSDVGLRERVERVK